MLETIISALLPILVILLLGYLAGRNHDFSISQASTLNTMIMLYTLPLSLFCGVITTPIQEIVLQKKLVFGLLLGMVAFYFLIFSVLKFIMRKDIKTSALLTLSICSPAVPFMGIPILNELIGGLSTLIVSICSLIINLIQMPVTIILLSMGENTGQGSNIFKVFSKNIWHSIKQPVVWAPVFALLLVLLHIPFPSVLIKSFELLGSTTSGIALFSSGIILFSYKITCNTTIIVSVLLRNIFIPLVTLGIIAALHFDLMSIKETVFSLAIPTASTAIILSIQYKTMEREIASILFYSTIFSIISLSLFIWILS